MLSTCCEEMLSTPVTGSQLPLKMEQARLSLWTSKPSTTESMMLDSDPLLYLADKDEVLHFIPSLKDASILELGCGIGRFTGELCHRARDVTAVDFMQKFLDVVRSNYGHLSNLTLICADMLTMEMAKKNFDIVFTGWMFTFLAQHEALRMIERVLEWLKPGGYLFFREPNPQTKVPKITHSSLWRSPLLYDKLLKGVTRNGYCLTITRCRSSRTYITLAEDTREVYYIAQKVPSYPSSPTSPAFAPAPSTLPLDAIKDKNFKAAGVVPGTTVLVLGCGSGGLVLHLARTYSVFVFGLDPAMENINTAMHRHQHLLDNVFRMVQFEMVATEDAEFDENFFDVILVRDSELRTPLQYRLLAKLRRWMKPGGKSYIIDDNAYYDDELPGECVQVWATGFSDEEADKLEKEVLTWKYQ